jgi:hypothetical protein
MALTDQERITVTRVLFKQGNMIVENIVLNGKTCPSCRQKMVIVTGKKREPSWPAKYGGPLAGKTIKICPQCLKL